MVTETEIQASGSARAALVAVAGRHLEAPCCSAAPLPPRPPDAL